MLKTEKKKKKVTINLKDMTYKIELPKNEPIFERLKREGRFSSYIPEETGEKPIIREKIKKEIIKLIKQL